MGMPRYTHASRSSSRLCSRLLLFASVLLVSFASIFYLELASRHPHNFHAERGVVRVEQHLVKHEPAPKHAEQHLQQVDEVTRLIAHKSTSKSSPAVNKHVKLDIPVWWFAPFLDQSSFGNEATMLISSLVQEDLADPSKMWIGLLQMDCKDQMAGIMDPHDHQMLLQFKQQADMNTPAVVVCHNMPKFFGKPSAPWRSCQPCPPPGYHDAYSIARAMAETDRYHSEFIGPCNSLDEVWVPSEFSRQVLAASGVDPAKLHVVPLGVNTTFLDPQAHAPLELPRGTKVWGLSDKSPLPPKGAPQRPFVFLSIFKWEGRKGWDVLLDAYLSEFTHRDEVQLYILTRPFLGGNGVKGQIETWAAQHVHKRAVKMPSLYVIEDQLSVEDYARLLAAVDAFVLPTRGEGWGIPIVEAMSMALPVIVTNFSGPSAYLDPAASYPLGYELAQVPDSEPYWFKGSRWAQPGVTQLLELMRHVVDNRAEARQKGLAARELMLDRYSPHMTALTLYKELRRIERKLQRLKPEQFMRRRGEGKGAGHGQGQGQGQGRLQQGQQRGRHNIH